MTNNEYMTAHTNQLAASITMVAAAITLCLLVYAPGLHGPFLLDDSENLKPVHSWLLGVTSWQSAVFENNSGPLGRPVSMASFTLSAYLGGHTPFSYKVGNLLIHLLVGAMAFLVLRQFARRDSMTSAHASIGAAFLACVWLLHPLNVSTVLYAVQRMTQLSALFGLLSMYFYLRAQALPVEQRAQARILMFIGTPVAAAAAMFSKENGALAPLIVMICSTLMPGAASHLRKERTAFTAMFLGLPLIAAMTMFLQSPTRLVEGYATRDFTLIERLLTQARVIVDYLASILLPNGPRLSLFRDDYPISTGVLDPPATLLCIAGLMAISIAAWILRTRMPLLIAGWLFFLIGHSTESSIFPLDLYYEHRNYLPMLGILLMLWSVAAQIKLPSSTKNTFTAHKSALAAYLVLLAFGTYSRAAVWGDEYALFLLTSERHPHSHRAALHLAALQTRRGEIDHSYDTLKRLNENPADRIKALALMHIFAWDCMYTPMASLETLDKAIQLSPPKITISERFAATLVRDAVINGCDGIPIYQIASRLEQMLDKATNQSDRIAHKQYIRALAAQIYLRAGQPASAVKAATKAWFTDSDPTIGMILAAAQIQNNTPEAAEATYQETSNRILPHQIDRLNELRQLRGFMDSKITMNNIKE